MYVTSEASPQGLSASSAPSPSAAVDQTLDPAQSTARQEPNRQPERASAPLESGAAGSTTSIADASEVLRSHSEHGEFSGQAQGAQTCLLDSLGQI